MEMNTIKVNGIHLAYTRHGQGAPLLLIHGFPLDHASWNQVASFLGNDFDMILPDLRGFGESTMSNNPYRISAMADDLAGLLDHLGIKKTAMAGHSMGGYVSLAFAKKYPQRVSGLALVSSQATADAPERRDGRYKTAQDVAEKGVSVVVEAMTPKLSAHANVQASVREMMKRQKPSAMIGALKAMAERENLLPLLSSFDFPLLLIHGDQDELIPLARSQEMKAALPASQIVVLQGAGHMPMMEFAKETADALKILR
ncbi:MAG: alpha/beta fold hydrolase [Anaerolineales bacterium]